METLNEIKRPSKAEQLLAQKSYTPLITALDNLKSDMAEIEIEEIAASGELVYIGPNVTLGYATKLSDLAHGDDFKSVLKTGDIVQRDKDGFYFIIGRKSRFLKIYGFRVSLDEVEHLIKNNFLVDCYASGNDSLLSVYVDDYSVLSEIKHWLVKKTNLFHQAIEVNYIPEIPRNLSGKVIITS